MFKKWVEWWMAERKRYPSDLSDDEWIILEPLIPAVKWGGRPADHARREIVNAILYVLRSGCQWRAMPHDLPPWQTRLCLFSHLASRGTWSRIHETLREKFVVATGAIRKPVPRSWTANLSRRRKRGTTRLRCRQENQRQKKAILTDTLGLILEVRVHAADHSRPWQVQKTYCSV